MNAYKVSLHQGVLLRDKIEQSQILHDLSEGPHVTASVQYLNQVVGLLLRTVARLYTPENLSAENRQNLRRYVEKVIEAKDAVDGKGPGGRE